MIGMWIHPRRARHLFAAVVAGVTGVALAQTEKKDFNFFHPVPDSLLRELSPDRPDKTESPYTVDAGHFQMEMDFANYTHDRTDGTTTRALNIAPFNLKAGLLNNVDLQIAFADYFHVRTDDPVNGRTTQSGVGDLTTRVKINLWGNDGGRTAFALLPFVKFPTSTDGLGHHAVEGGVIVPLAINLPLETHLGLETGVTFSQDTTNGRYHQDFINSVTVGHALVGGLSGYVEFFSDVSNESQAGWVGTVDAGLCFSVTHNIQLDGGCNFGVTSAADDFNPFAGITWRF